MYQPEEELAVYGVTHALASYNPVGPTSRRSVISRRYPSRPSVPSTSYAPSSLIRHGARSALPRSHRPRCRRAPHFGEIRSARFEEGRGLCVSHFLLLSAAGGALHVVRRACLARRSGCTCGRRSRLGFGARWLFRAPALGVSARVARQMAGIGLVASYAVDRFGAGAGLMIVIGFFLALVGLFVGFRPDRHDVHIGDRALTAHELDAIITPLGVRKGAMSVRSSSTMAGLFDSPSSPASRTISPAGPNAS